MDPTGVLVGSAECRVDTDSHGGDVWFIRGFLARLIDVNGGQKEST